MNIKTFKSMVLGVSVAVFAPLIAHAGGGTFQTANMQHFADGSLAAGAATLNRHGDGIHLRVTGSVFTGYAVYSAWFIVFNNANKCADGPGACAGSDLGNPAVDAAVLNAGGFVATGDGNGYFTGSLGTGPAPNGMCCFGKLKNGNKAEVHIILLDHGPRNPGEIAVHMSTPGGGVDQFFFVFPPAK